MIIKQLNLKLNYQLNKKIYEAQEAKDYLKDNFLDIIKNIKDNKYNQIKYI